MAHLEELGRIHARSIQVVSIELAQLRRSGLRQRLDVLHSIRLRTHDARPWLDGLHAHKALPRSCGCSVSASASACCCTASYVERCVRSHERQHAAHEHWREEVELRKAGAPGLIVIAKKRVEPCPSCANVREISVRGPPVAAAASMALSDTLGHLEQARVALILQPGVVPSLALETARDGAFPAAMKPIFAAKAPFVAENGVGRF